MRLAVWGKPGSGRTEVGGDHGGALVVRVTEPVADGRANAAACRAVAEAFGIPRTDVQLVRGRTSRAKVLEVTGETDALSQWEAALRSG